MKFILLLPIVIYLALMAVNLELLRDFQTINLFWAQVIQAPIIMFSSFFIVLYAVIVYLSYSGINAIQSRKLKKLDRQIVDLKSELYNNQKELLKNIKEDYREQFLHFKNDNDKKLETLIRFNEYTLEKVIDETSGHFTKYRKETQKLLAKSKWVDQNLFSKLKVWK